MYRVSGKHLVALALASALIAAIVVACAQRAINGSDLKIEPTAIADPTVATDEQNNIDVYRNVSPGVVNITNRGYRNTFFGPYPTEGSGSGSIIDDKGHILTNFHVIQGASELEVQIEDDKFPARLVGTDPNNDLAVIKVEAPRERLTIIKLGTSSGLQVGQKVLAIGNPFGLQRTLTTGVISGLERPLQSASRRVIEGAIQTDASINPGNSGGPLLNARGEVIGINTMIYSPSGGSVGIGFAVPVDTAKKILPDLIARGYVPQPWIGVSGFPIDKGVARQLRLPVTEGLLVSQVTRGSGAAAAGIRPATINESPWGSVQLEELGDIILSVGGQAIKNSNDIDRALKDRQPGQTIQVEVLRGNARLNVNVRLAEKPRTAND